MPVLAVANQKGGVGKTTTSINLASALAESGKRVLLVDLDPQGNATTSLGFNRREILVSTYEVLLEDRPLELGILATIQDNLFLLPANENLPGAEIELVERDKRAHLLRFALEQARVEYDFVLLDCPPSLGILTLNGLAASDGLLIAMQAEFLALDGLSQLLKTVGVVRERLNPDLEVAGVVITMYDGRTRLTREVEETLRRFFQDSARVFDTTIPRTVRLAEAPSHGLPINIYAPGSPGSEAFRNLALEVIDATETRIGEGVGSFDPPVIIAGEGVLDRPDSQGSPGERWGVGTGAGDHENPPEPEPAP
jgi:chromosome partitioning protein